MVELWVSGGQALTKTFISRSRTDHYISITVPVTYKGTHFMLVLLRLEKE